MPVALGNNCACCYEVLFLVGRVRFSMPDLAVEETSIASPKVNTVLPLLRKHQVEYRFNYDTAVPKGDWLGIVVWGEEPSAKTCVVRKPLQGTSTGKVRTICISG